MARSWLGTKSTQSVRCSIRAPPLATQTKGSGAFITQKELGSQVKGKQFLIPGEAQMLLQCAFHLSPVTCLSFPKFASHGFSPSTLEHSPQPHLLHIDHSQPAKEVPGHSHDLGPNWFTVSQLLQQATGFKETHAAFSLQTVVLTFRALMSFCLKWRQRE